MRVLLLDIDDCLAGPIWPLSDRPRRPVDRAVAGQILTECERAGVSIHFLTNRPPGQLPVLAQIFGGPAKYHFAESGLTAWLPDENRAIVNPSYEDFADQVIPEIRRRLSGAFSLSWRGPMIEEFGTRLVTMTLVPLRAASAEVAALVNEVHEILSGLPVTVRQGKGVDIMPAGATKECGCRWAEELHPLLHGEPLNWPDVLYVEDSTTGLEAARYVAERGGTVAAVANASPVFKKAVAEAGGMLCQHDGERGVLEAVRRWLAD